MKLEMVGPDLISKKRLEYKSVQSRNIRCHRGKSDI